MKPLATTEPAFYDGAMTGRGAPAMLPLEDSPWLPLYQEAGRWIPGGHDIVDLGCGTGRFLGYLDAAGHLGRLHGIDFSQRALTEAEEYLVDLGVEIFTLERCDLRHWQPDPERAGGTSYACLEVLEHLEDDRELVKRIPPGHQVVFSVPNYESAAHLRVFRNVGDVFGRYERWLTFKRWTLVELGDGKAIHVCDTERRVDSW